LPLLLLLLPLLLLLLLPLPLLLLLLLPAAAYQSGSGHVSPSINRLLVMGWYKVACWILHVAAGR
jgi:hypothetical protein